jgi:hypothetical protein
MTIKCTSDEYHSSFLRICMNCRKFILLKGKASGKFFGKLLVSLENNITIPVFDLLK